MNNIVKQVKTLVDERDMYERCNARQAETITRLEEEARNRGWSHARKVNDLEVEVHDLTTQLVEKSLKIAEIEKLLLDSTDLLLRHKPFMLGLYELIGNGTIQLCHQAVSHLEETGFPSESQAVKRLIERVLAK